MATTILSVNVRTKLSTQPIGTIILPQNKYVNSNAVNLAPRERYRLPGYSSQRVKCGPTKTGWLLWRHCRIRSIFLSGTSPHRSRIRAIWLATPHCTNLRASLSDDLSEVRAPPGACVTPSPLQFPGCRKPKNWQSGKRHHLQNCEHGGRQGEEIVPCVRSLPLPLFPPPPSPLFRARVSNVIAALGGTFVLLWILERATGTGNLTVVFGFGFLHESIFFMNSLGACVEVWTAMVDVTIFKSCLFSKAIRTFSLVGELFNSIEIQHRSSTRHRADFFRSF